jgi:hypothetical protein
MNLFRLLIIVAIVFAGVHFWNGYQERKTIASLTSSNGFIPVPMPTDTTHNTVLVFAPDNCPKEGAQRAIAMVKRLNELGITTIKTSRYAAQAFEPNPETEAGFKRLNSVMTGEIPVVLVNGMGKANPTVDEVVAEYNRTK